MARRLLVSLCALAALALPAAAHAAVTPFGTLPCTTPDGAAGARFCGSEPPTQTGQPGTVTLVPTFDGTSLDTNVALPPASQGDGPFPLIVLANGWGGQKDGFTSGGEAGYIGTMKDLANKGYAVLSATARGFNGSCGNLVNRLQNSTACSGSFIRLDDYRYEAMDIEYLAGNLVDQGIALPAIGVGGESYGGGVSLELAVLRNRMCSDMYGYGASKPRCPALVPWTTRKGTPMSIAAATPIIPWSDLVYSLLPNGRTLDYTITNPYVDAAHAGDDASVPGVEKSSYVSGLFALGRATGYYQPGPNPSADTDADLTTWFARINAGEPYTDPVSQHIIDLIARFRSPYDMPWSADGPAPLFISNGWTDDLFPPDEALRFYNRERAQFPDNPIALLFANHGHSRGGNLAADVAIIRARVQAEFDHFLKGDQSVAAPTGVETYLTQCPAPKAGHSTGPISAATWSAIHPGEVRFRAVTAATVPAQGDPNENKVSDPIANTDPCATVSNVSDQSGSATYRLPTVTGAGYTLLGSPTIDAKFAVSGGGAAQIVGRLWDVAPDGSETLVAKGVYRPAGSGTEVFQLHADGWHFAAGHTPRLQLLQSDTPYLRASNGASSISASDLELRLPTAEPADCIQVLSPAAPVLPDPATGLSRVLAPGVAATGTGTCSAASQTSVGATPGTLGGRALDKNGVVVGSAGSKAGRYRIKFGKKRYRTIGSVRHSGIGVILHCSGACTVTADLKSGPLRIGRGRRTAKGNFVIHVRPTKTGLRRLERHRRTNLRFTVTIVDGAGRRVARRTGGYVVRVRRARG